MKRNPQTNREATYMMYYHKHKKHTERKIARQNSFVWSGGAKSQKEHDNYVCLAKTNYLSLNKFTTPLTKFIIRQLASYSIMRAQKL